MSSYQGFLSYVHKDDDAEQGRISQLAKDIASQYEMLTGEEIELFLDREDLQWGDNWQNKIDENLASVAFFIPVITPRYFTRPECRRELQFFARRADQLGIKELVLPLHYVHTPLLEDNSNQDDLVELVRKFQWEDWREIRFMDSNSELYRRRVADLASRLVEANRAAEISTEISRISTIEDEFEDDEYGSVDLMAMAEETLPFWQETINSIGIEIHRIGGMLHEATAEVKSKNTYASRVVVASRLARKLNDPVESILNLSNDFSSQLNDINSGLREIIRQLASEVKDNPENQRNACIFFGQIEAVTLAARESFGNVQDMIAAMSPLEKKSRDLRPVIRRLTKGLTILSEARGVMDDWVILIDSSGIDCLQEPEGFGETWDSLSHYGAEKAQLVARERGLDWKVMPELEREVFIDDLVHED
jgi:methyl-accepting chemotaxis protein